MLVHLDVTSLLTALKSCANTRDLERGRRLHAEATQAGDDSNVFVASSLVNMYAKCGSVEEARKLFHGMKRRDVVSWTAMVMGYAENGEAKIALEIFESMKSQGCAPNARTFVAALKACSVLAGGEEAREVDGRLLKVEALEKGKSLHVEAVEMNFHSNVFVANTLVDMYSNCGDLSHAREVFEKMSHRTVVTWNSLILGYAEHDEETTALKMFASMSSAGCPPNSRSFVAALKACSSLGSKEERRRVDGASLKTGREIHSLAGRSGLDMDVYVGSTLIDMYVKCGSSVEARRVFDRLQHRECVVTYNAMILGYAENGEEELALELLRCMRAAPDSRTYVAALRACAGLAENEEASRVDGRLVKIHSLEKGMAVHSRGVRERCTSDVFVCNMLVQMYSQCGSSADAWRVFDSMAVKTVVTFTSLMIGSVEEGEPEVALNLYSEMVRTHEPNPRACVAAAKACAKLAKKEQGCPKLVSLEKGMKLHVHAEENGLLHNVFLASSLVDMYAACGRLEDARRVFDRMAPRDVVSWTSMILRYGESGDGASALEIYSCMKAEGCLPDTGTFVAILRACACLLDLEVGKEVHGEICSRGLEGEGVLATCLVDFYGKCGSLVESQVVFDTLEGKDSVTWSSLIAGYSRQGKTELVFGLFERMVEEGLSVDGPTLLSVLTSCGHAGMVERGREYFGMMSSGRFGVSPGIEHYHCMIDLLGRANKLEEALAVVESMPFEASVVTWRTVLAACRVWKNVNVGKVAFEKLLGETGLT